MIKKLAVLLVIIPSLAFAVAPDAPTNVAPNMNPNWVLDETFPFRVYGPNGGGWITEIAFGNMKASMAPWYDAPSDEVGWGRGNVCADGPENNGKLYCSVHAGENWPILVERDYSTGIVRLVLSEYGTVEGDSHEAAGGHPFYNSYDDTVYLMGNGHCIRKLVDDGDGTQSVSLVAGDCSVAGHVDDNGSAARFGGISGAAADGAGNIWVLDTYSSTNYVRKIDVKGTVTSVNGSIVRDDRASHLFSLLTQYTSINVSPGRTSTQMHFSDTWNNSSKGWSSQHLNTTTYAMTRIVGIDFSADTYKRFPATGGGYEKDGPGLTHAYLLASGRCAVYSPFYDAILLSGQDNSTIQIYYYDTGWVYGVAHLLRPWLSAPTYTDEEFQAGSFPSEYNPLNSQTRIPTILGTDRYGGIYYTMAGNIKLTFRMYNPTLGGLALGDIQ